MKTQIGWYIVDRDTVFRDRNFSCAAWWEDIEVKAGKYPVCAYDMQVDNDGRVISNDVSVSMDGTIVADYSAGHFCGMPISDYDTKKNAGEPSSYYMSTSLPALVDNIIQGDGKWELLPEFEPRKYEYINWYDDKVETAYGIFKTPSC